MNRRLLQVAAFLTVALVAACAGGAPAPSPTPAPSASPAASPSGPARLKMGSLAAGTYHTNRFVPELILTLPDGWSQFFPDEDDEIFIHDANAELAISRPAQVRDPESSATVDAPEDLMAWLEGHPALNASEPTDVTISGIASGYVEVEPEREVRLFAFPGGDFRLAEGVRQRIYVVPLEGLDIAASVLVPQGGELSTALEAAVPIVESLVIVP